MLSVALGVAAGVFLAAWLRAELHLSAEAGHRAWLQKLLAKERQEAGRGVAAAGDVIESHDRDILPFVRKNEARGSPLPGRHA